MKRTVLFALAMTLCAAPLFSRTDNGTIEVRIAREGDWISVGAAHFGKHVTTSAFNLPAGTPTDVPLRIRLDRSGGGAAHIDAVVVPGFSVAKGAIETAKLGSADFDLVPIQSELELALSPDATTDRAGAADTQLTISARIEPEIISKTPFFYPEVNTYHSTPNRPVSYWYRLDQEIQGALTVDGSLDGEGLAEPFFEATIPVGSGHPQGTTYGWVTHDDEYLYVALDFTPDNTMDGDVDYAAVHVSIPDDGGAGIRTRRFRVAMNETKWGLPGFTYTDKVSYQHKVYEFAIPHAETGIDAETQAVALAFETYGTATPNGSALPELVYNTLQNEYMLFFQEGNSDLQSRDDIMNVRASRLDYAGTQLGLESLVATDAALIEPFGLIYPDLDVAAAHDWINNRYLVVWTDNSDEDAYTEIYGALLNGDGTTTGLPAIGQISGGFADLFLADVAFDPIRERYLVVFVNDYSGYFSIIGRFVDADGTVDTDPVFFTPQFGGATWPSVAFDPVSDRYLVVFTDDRNSYIEVWGAIMTGDARIIDTTTGDDYGSAYGDGSSVPPTAEFRILTRDFYDQRIPDLTYDEIRQRFVLAVTDTPTDSVLLKTIDAAGRFEDHDGNGSADAEDFVSVSSDTGDRISVDHNPTIDKFLVAWDYYVDATNEEEIFSSPVAGSTLTAEGVTTSAAGAFQGDLAPSVAANPAGQNFLIAYYTYEYGTESRSIETVAEGFYVEDPTLKFTQGTEGTSVTSGTSGTRFSFEVEYTSSTNKPPAPAELWIDASQDGAYQETRGVPPFNRPTLPFAGAGLLVAVALLVLLRSRTRAIRIAGVAGVILATSLLVGCNQLASTSRPFAIVIPGSTGIQERFQMFEADRSDTDYTDGKLYVASVKVTAEPGSVPYRFVFSNGTRRAYGYGATERRLTITP